MSLRLSVTKEDYTAEDLDILPVKNNKKIFGNSIFKRIIDRSLYNKPLVHIALDPYDKKPQSKHSYNVKIL